jgi:hypothetical protein
LKTSAIKPSLSVPVQVVRVEEIIGSGEHCACAADDAAIATMLVPIANDHRR